MPEPERAPPPKSRGRAVGWRKPPLKPRSNSSGCGYSISRWCQDADISRTRLYALWTAACGPRSVRVGGRRLISESPAQFLERLALRDSPGTQAAASTPEV
jgi:hypothetical protein